MLQKPDCPCATPAQTSVPDRVQAMELWSPQGLRTLKFPCPGMWKPLFHPRMADFLYMESPGSCNNIRISARARSFMHLHCVCCSFPLEITERKQICFCKILISTLPRWSILRKLSFSETSFSWPLWHLWHPGINATKSQRIYRSDSWATNCTATLQVSVKRNPMSLLHPQQHHLLSQALTVMSHNGFPTDKHKTPSLDFLL